VLEYRILGPVELTGEAGPIPLGGQKQRALLALLLLHAGAAVSTDRIVDELWGKQPPKTATTSLQNFISQLRKLLGAETLVTKPPGYALRIEPDQLDAQRFERLLSEAREADAGERASKLRDALALWRGPPLADLAFEAFAQGEIRRLEELRLDAVEQRIEADLELGRGAELTAELKALVQEHPLRERLRGQQMLALYRAGRQAEALEAYHEARRVLVDELGIEPSPALQQLYRSILRQESGLEAAFSSPVARPEDHLADVVRAILGGRLVPVVGAGAGASLVADGDGHALLRPQEVAAHLARCFDCPPDHDRELARVCEYVVLTEGVGPLYDELHALFGREYLPGPVHRLLAELAGVLRERDVPRQLIVTANFDWALEQAFAEAGEPIDVVTYIAVGRHRGKFLHVAPDGTAAVVEVPNSYADLAPEERTVILKIHGQVDREPAREWESFVVSEDDYIDYLAQADISSLVPATLVARLRRSHFLFLGYPIRDWGLRVFLHRVWGRDKLSYRSWAVEAGGEPIERELWRQRGIDVLDVEVDEYADRLRARLETIAAT
jgi:DNA-binding SARP family transcriptional activator